MGHRKLLATFAYLGNEITVLKRARAMLSVKERVSTDGVFAINFTLEGGTWSGDPSFAMCAKFSNRCSFSIMYQIFLIQISF